MTEHDDHPIDYLAELALGVLGESEASPIHAHLAGCESCRNEFDEMSRVARLLPLAAEDAEPPAAVKEGVFARIAREPQANDPAMLPRTANIIRPRRWQWAGAVAASIAAFVVGGAALGYLVRGGGNASLEREAVFQAQVVESAARGDLRVARIQDGTMRAAIVRAPGSHQAYILAENLPAHENGKAYQAWFSKDGKTFEPSSVFTDAQGRTWLTAAGPVDEYAAIGLTIEDADGASTPSSAPFMLVDLTKSVRAR